MVDDLKIDRLLQRGSQGLHEDRFIVDGVVVVKLDVVDTGRPVNVCLLEGDPGI